MLKYVGVFICFIAQFNFFISSQYTPVVLWHGMGDSCCNPLSLGSFKRMIEDQLPGIYVRSLMIGDGLIKDWESGYFGSVNEHVDFVCNALRNDANLTQGYNAIGISQGGQFLRAVAQRCSNPPMKNLISLGGQHQGVYGLPSCPGANQTVCDWIRKLLNNEAYSKLAQSYSVQAQYWHDPLNDALYQNYSVFLADINQERAVNKTYRDNLLLLKNFVMVMFERDVMVQPKESEWFGYYSPGQAKEIVPLQKSVLYLEDRLGLKEMDQQNRLHFLSVDGGHIQFNDTWFTEQILKPYLSA